MKKIAFALLTIFSLFVISCEIGLGASVDTDPPSLNISNPPVDAIIRDDFALSGTWTDDGTIGSISVELSRTDGNGEKLSYTGTFAEDSRKGGSGTWSIDIPAKSSSITDGTYQAVVTIKDATDRTTIQNTTFTIDNTAPILILQRPATDVSTTDEASIDTYGKILSLEGRAADDNNIDHIDVKIYSDAAKSNLLHTINLKNVPLSIALDAAKWGDEAYNTIYGTTVGDKRRYYCSIEAYDSAQRYPADGSAQNDEDKNGNCATDYYLYNDIANSSLADLKVTELYSALNGTNSRSAVDTNTVRNTLNQLKKSTGTFFLNPQNNPTFKLSGWRARTYKEEDDPATTQDETNDIADEGFVTFDNASINFDVEPGLDNYPIDRNSLKVYLIEAEYYRDGDTWKVRAKENAPKMYLSNDVIDIKGASTYKVAVTIDRSKPVYDENGSQLYDANDPSKALKVGMGDYIAVIDGNDIRPDQRDNELLPETLISGVDGYPISIANTGGAPKLTVSYNLNGVNKTDPIIYMPRYQFDTNNTPSVLKVSGTVEANSEADADQPTDFQIIVDNGTNQTSINALTRRTGSDTIYEFNNIEVTIPNLTTSEQHSLLIKASNGSTAASTAQELKSIMYDAEGPKIENLTVTPIASTYKDNPAWSSASGNIAEPYIVDETDFINGKIIVSGSITDDFDVVDKTIHSPKIEVCQNGSLVKVYNNISSPNFNLEINTNDSEFSDNVPVTINVIAYDRSGMKSIEPITDYTIKQSTDKPIIKSGDRANVTLDYEYSQITNKTVTRKNVFNKGTQFPVQLFDDDGLKKAKLTYVKVISDSNQNPITDPSWQAKDPIEKTLSGYKNTAYFDLPQDSGYYKMWLEVTDTASPANVTTTEPFYIQVASGLPVVTVKSNEFVTNNTTGIIDTAATSPLKVEINIKSTEEGFKILRKAFTGTSEPDLESCTDADYILDTKDHPITYTDANQTSIDLEDNYLVPGTSDGEYKIKYFVLDGSDNLGIAILKYKLDNTAPDISDWKLEDATLSTDYYSSSSLNLQVTATDSGSKVSNVEYSLDNGANWTPLTAGTTANTYKRLISFTNGDNRVIVRATDNVGNYSEDPKIVKVDIQAPNFAVTGNSSNSEGDIIYINAEQKNNSLSIYGEYSDDQSGVGALTVKLGNNSADVRYYTGPETDQSQISGSDYNQEYSDSIKNSIKFWKATFTSSQLQSAELSFTGKDKCNNEIRVTQNISVMIDDTPPVLENITLNSETNKGLYKASNTLYYVNPALGTSYTLTGIAKDTGTGIKTGVKKVTCQIDDGTPLESTSAGWTFDIPFTGASNGTEKTIKLKVYDNAENASADNTYVYTIKVDSKAPVIEYDIDDSQKNLRFRIGNYKNDAGDPDVGGKYSNGTYGNATTIMIRGYIPDYENGSGIGKYYYWVSDREVKIDSSKANASVPVTGTGDDAGKIFFKDTEVLTQYVIDNCEDTFTSIAEETKRVEYNINSEHKAAEMAKCASGQPNPENIEYVKEKAPYSQFRKDVPSNFKTTIKGFQEGSNYLVIVVEDNVGNTSLDCATVGGVDYPCYSLNVDTNTPEILEQNENDFNNVILGNGTEAVSFDFDVQELTSRILEDAFTVKLGTSTLTLTSAADLQNKTAEQKKALSYVEIENKDSNDKYPVTLHIGTNAFTSVSGPQSVQVTVEDEAHNASAATIVGTINVDKTAPTIRITSDSSVNRFINNSITATVYANDTNGITGATASTGGKVYYNIRENGSTTNLRTDNKSADINKDDGTCEISIVNTEISDTFTFDPSKTYVLVIWATDGAGNTGTKTSDAYSIDHTGPDFNGLTISEIDYTALGTNYFKDTTLTISGSFKDENGSGVSLVYYKLNGDERTVTPVAGSNGLYNFTASVGVFNEGINTFEIWAKDKVGNVGSDEQIRSVTVKIDTTAPEITEKTAGDFDNTQLTNGTVAKTFVFNVEEAASGIDKDATAFAVKLGTNTVLLTSAADLDGKTDEQKKALSYVEVADAVNGVYEVSLHVGTDAFTGLSGNKSLKVSVKDKLENTSTYTVVGNINKDDSDPEPSFTYPKYGTTNGTPDTTKIPEVNKTITISGKIKEANAVEEITLTATPPASASGKISKTYTYKKTPGTGETNTLAFDVDTKEWSVEGVDTYVAAWNTTADVEEWTLSISVTDEAGNTGTETQKMKIDQDSDRPVITLTSLTLPDTYVKKNYQTSELSGYLRDDDGESKVPASMKYRIGATGEFKNDNKIVYSDETGQFTLTLGDAEQDVYFEITDTEGGVFTTKVYNGTVADTDLFDTPKLTDKADTKYGYKGSESTVKNTVLKLKVDTQKPEISSWHFTRTPDVETSWATAISTEDFGGTKNTFHLRAEASDLIGVEKVYLSVPVKNKSGEDTTKDGVSDAITSWVYTDENKITYTLYTKGNNPTTASKVWEDINDVGNNAEAKSVTIEAVDSDFTDLTISSNAYTRTAYIFPLEDTEPTKENNEVHKWQSPSDKPVNVSGLLTGTRAASLYAYDGTSNSNPNNVSISIDNTPPVISFTGPANNKTLSGGITAYGGVDSAEKVYYAVSTSDTIHPEATGNITKWFDSNNTGHNFIDNVNLNENTETYTIGSTTYNFWAFKEISRNANNSWSVEFDGASGEGEHQQTLKDYLIKYKIATSDQLDVSKTFDSIVLLYIWIKAEDKCGNISYEKTEVNFDPQGDRPTITFSNPSVDGETYKDKPQISGSTTDPASNAIDTLGIESIWLQIVSTKHSKDSSTGKIYGSFTVNSTSKAIENLSIKKADLDYLAGLKDSNNNFLYNIYNMKTYHTDSAHTRYNGSGVTDDTAKDYAIRIAPSGYSWLATINAGGELDFVPAAGATGNDKINQVAVRVYAQDKDGKLSLSQDRYMIFDSQSPTIGNKDYQPLYLIKSDSVAITTTGSGTSAAPNFGATASKEYKDDGYVRGNWYLIGSVDDNDKIQDLTIDNKVLAQYNSTTSITSTNQITTANDSTWATWTSTDAKVIYFKYKVDTSGVGEKNFKIEVKDQANTPNSKDIIIKYDNTAPELVGAGDAAYNISPAVKQSNGYYSFGSKVTENPSGDTKQSGLDFVAFYFMRRNTTGDSEVDTVYNPMLASNNSTSITAANISYESGLYWFKKTVTVSGNKLTFTQADTDVKYIRENGLVRINGSLYKIKKDSKSNTEVALIDSTGLDANPPSDATEAYFALALLSDNTKAEKGNGRNTTTFYPNTITGDDGDGFIDSVDVSDNGATNIWSAEIVSKNIPDGPIELHYVAFDKAGNYSIGIMGTKSETDFRTSTTLAATGDRTEYTSLVGNTSRASNVLYVDGASRKSHYNGTASNISADSEFADAAYVRNNAPRLAAVKIWTDYDGNGSEGSGESNTKYVSQLKDVSGNLTSYAGGATSTFVVSKNDKDYIAKDGETVTGVAYMTIRDKTEFTPEIVGGNGVLKYQSRIAKASDLEDTDYSSLSGNWITGTNVQVEDDKSSYMNDNQTYVDLTKTRHGTITFGATAAEWSALGENSTEEDPYWFEYKIWDSTDGATCGTDSLSAVMRVALNVQYFDSSKPWARIRPFYWNSSTENSLEWGTDSSGNRKALGHIELETDVNDAMKEALGEASATVLDPKVSGKIKVEGYVYDNIRLKEIHAQFTDHAGLSNFTKIAEYDSGSWGSSKSGTGWSATVQNVYSNAKGHMAKFTLILDTESVASGKSVAALNRVLKIYAVDARGANGGNSSQSLIGSNQTSNITPTFWSTVKGATDEERAEALETYYVDVTCKTPVTTETEDDTIVYTATDIETYKPYYQMDVVPYITGIKTELSDGNKKRPTVLSRSALGVYPVRRGSNITVEGYNLNGTSTKVKIGDSEYTPINGSTTNSLIVTTDADTTSSGVDAVVGTISSLNNVTKKTVEYNQEPNNQNNDNLTNERILHVVDVYTTTNTTDKRMLDMAVIGDDLYFSAGYGADYFASMRANGTTIDTIKGLRQSYTRYFDNAMTVTNDGTIFTISACGDSYHAVSEWDDGPSHLALTKSNPGTYVWEYYGTYTNTNTRLLFLESNWNGANLNNLDRYKLPDLVVKGSSTNATGYISYYDTTLKAIKFRYFTSTDKVANNLTAGIAGTALNGASVANSVEGTIRNDNPTGKTYNQGYYVIASANENSSYSSVGVTGNTALVSWYDATSGVLRMKYNTNPAASFSGYQTFTTLPSAGTVKFNLSVDGKTAKPVSVIYSNPSGGDAQHEFAYQLNLVLSQGGYGAFAEVTPVQGNSSKNVTVRSMQTGSNSTIAITGLSSGTVGTAEAGSGQPWNLVTVDEASAGQYVAMKTDSKGGIHFAYYDTGNGDLKYSYMSSITATPVVVTVEGYQQVGQYVDLALKETTVGTKTNVTPYISYYSMSNADTKRAAKVAKLVSPITYTTSGQTVTVDSSSITTGSEDELFTGNWEAMHIPTNGVPVQYRVNIGVTSSNVYISYLADRIIEYVKVE